MGLKVAIIGAGWAGLAAAVSATKAGHNATVYEASSAIGGRARAINSIKQITLPDGTPVNLDNGQHILIGAYTETLRLMRLVGIKPQEMLLNLPMTLQFPDGLGLKFGSIWPTPFDALGAILSAQGWTGADKRTLLGTALGWQFKGFTCAADLSVAALCQNLSPKVKAELIEPLCVSALNTPADRACAQVFLRVLRDALFGIQGGSRLLLPKVDLSALFPDAAALWLRRRGGKVQVRHRIQLIRQHPNGWLVDDTIFDAVILANTASNSAQTLINSALTATETVAFKMREWADTSLALQFEAIATVYAWHSEAKLTQPMLSLRSGAHNPAQFVFDRGQLGGPAGLLAFVVSASEGERATLEQQVLAQAKLQLDMDLLPVQTVVEKRATFACTPNLRRPPTRIAAGLLACGDHCAGPYPATLEGAVRSGVAAAQALTA